MKVLLVSEGSHEGNRAEEKPQALQALVGRVLPAETEYDWLDVHDLPRGNPFPGKGRGHFKLALKAMWQASRNGFDALVLVTDADRRPERIEEFDEAQKSEKLTIPRALGIAVEAFDAWILADHQAWSRVMGRTVQPQKDPESFDGGKGSLGHPKQVCRSLVEQFEWDGSQAQCYEAVCQRMDLEAVARRCSKGFGPFLERLRHLRQLLTPPAIPPPHP